MIDIIGLLRTPSAPGHTNPRLTDPVTTAWFCDLPSTYLAIDACTVSQSGVGVIACRNLLSVDTLDVKCGLDRTQSTRLQSLARHRSSLWVAQLP